MSSSDRNQEDARLLQIKLCRYTRQGDLDRVRHLVLDRRAAVDYVEVVTGKTPLVIAALHHHVEVVRFFLEKGANVHTADHKGNTALSLAIRRGHVGLAQLLLEHGANVEEPVRILLFPRDDPRMYSPLAWSIGHANVAMVELLLRFGAKTDETLAHGKFLSAWFCACAGGNNAEIVRLLQHYRVDINHKIIKSSSSNKTALCEACLFNSLEVAQHLIGHGARVIVADDDDPNSPSPLTRAISRGSLELVQFLLDNSPFSSSPSSTSDNGEDKDYYRPLNRPLGFALSNKKLEVAQLLVDHGALQSEFPHLFQCASAGNLEGSRLLLRAGANVNQPDDEDDDDDSGSGSSSRTPLWIAACHGHAHVVQELLHASADVNMRDSLGGETPLGVAYRNGHKGCMYLLLRTCPQVWPRLKNYCL